MYDFSTRSRTDATATRHWAERLDRFAAGNHSWSRSSPPKVCSSRTSTSWAPFTTTKEMRFDSVTRDADGRYVFTAGYWQLRVWKKGCAVSVAGEACRGRVNGVSNRRHIPQLARRAQRPGNPEDAAAVRPVAYRGLPGTPNSICSKYSPAW